MQKIIRPKEAAEYTGYSVSALAQWCHRSRGLRKVGKPIVGPAWVETPAGVRRGYTQAALDEWLASMEVSAA